jgi:glycosyltransferase involved in cell wall biosynthesis
MADAPAFEVVRGRAPQPAIPVRAASTTAATLDLLMVVPMVPYPPVWGYAQRCFQLARQLARRHRVTMLCYSLADQAGDVADLAEHVHEIVTVPQRPTPSWRRRLGQLGSIWSRDPYHSSGTRTSAMQATVDELVRSRRIDAVIIESSQMGWLSVPADLPVYVDEHNIESELLERMARSEHSVLRRLFYQVEHRRYRRFEDAVWDRSAGCAATSRRDASMITSRRPEIPVAVVPNGVDVEQFSPGGDDPVPSRLVFTGLLDYRPNYDGIHWFLDEVYPLIRRSHPSVELQVRRLSPSSPCGSAGELG